MVKTDGLDAVLLPSGHPQNFNNTAKQGGKHVVTTTFLIQGAEVNRWHAFLQVDNGQDIPSSSVF